MGTSCLRSRLVDGVGLRCLLRSLAGDRRCMVSAMNDLSPSFVALPLILSNVHEHLLQFQAEASIGRHRLAKGNLRTIISRPLVDHCHQSFHGALFFVWEEL